MSSKGIQKENCDFKHVLYQVFVQWLWYTPIFLFRWLTLVPLHAPGPVFLIILKILLILIYCYTVIVIQIEIFSMCYTTMSSGCGIIRFFCFGGLLGSPCMPQDQYFNFLTCMYDPRSFQMRFVGNLIAVLCILKHWLLLNSTKYM